MKPSTWLAAGVASLFLLGGAPVRAGIQVRDRICWVGTGDWQLRERDGAVCLVPCRWSREERLPRSKDFPWQISTPTIKDAEGRFLAGDSAGRSPTVHLVSKKGTNTRWTFEIVARLTPKPVRGERPSFRQGPSGYTFRVKQAEGPFAGWYLAAGTPVKKREDGKTVEVRPVKLVKNVREATVFTYIETNYFVDHK